MKIVFFCFWIALLLYSCGENNDFNSITSPIDRYICSIENTTHMFDGAVITHSPSEVQSIISLKVCDSYGFREPTPAQAGLEFVDLYFYDNGIITKKMENLVYYKSDATAYVAVRYLDDPSMMEKLMNCYKKDLRPELLKLSMVTPRFGGYEHFEGDTIEGGSEFYYFPKKSIDEAIDGSLNCVSWLPTDLQGEVIARIAQQFTAMTISSNAKTRFRSKPEADYYHKRVLAGDSKALLRKYGGGSVLEGCYAIAEDVVGREVSSTHFPLYGSRELNPPNDGQRVDCDPNRYDACYMMAATKAEAGKIFTKLYSYKFSVAALDARREKGQVEYVRDSTPFDPYNPFPILEKEMVESMTLDTAQMTDCPAGSSISNGLILNKSFNDINYGSYETSAKTNDLLSQNQASFQLTGFVTLVNSDDDPDIRCQTAKHKE
jgi:hypothetical protein